MKSLKITSDLYLIPLDLLLPGFTNFIGVWLYRGEETYLVDVGPAASISNLLAVLNNLGIEEIDAILLTHIHLDHAGGIGEIARAFPKTPILCHTIGIPHLIDTSQLWEGTLKTLGETGKAYGPIQSIPSHRLIDVNHATSGIVTPMITPGHAAHHVSYRIGSYVFLGEAGGVFFSLPDNRMYLRPATPSPFFLERALNSIDILLEANPEIVCYGHLGMSRDGEYLLKTHRRQLLLWESIVENVMDVSDKVDRDIVPDALNALFDRDPLLEGFHKLKDSQKEREIFFLENSIRGFEGYIRRKRQERG